MHYGADKRLPQIAVKEVTPPAGGYTSSTAVRRSPFPSRGRLGEEWVRNAEEEKQ